MKRILVLIGVCLSIVLAQDVRPTYEFDIALNETDFSLEQTPDYLLIDQIDRLEVNKALFGLSVEGESLLLELIAEAKKRGIYDSQP